MKTINQGIFIADSYIKKVSFNKAVLWKDKQISLNKKITDQFRSRGITKVIFDDESKKEKWIAKVEQLRNCAIYKKEGQEPQFYFPITAFKKVPYEKA